LRYRLGSQRILQNPRDEQSCAGITRGWSG
jgi:hypothetical protein